MDFLFGLVMVNAYLAHQYLFPEWKKVKFRDFVDVCCFSLIHSEDADSPQQLDQADHSPKPSHYPVLLTSVSTITILARNTQDCVVINLDVRSVQRCIALNVQHTDTNTLRNCFQRLSVAPRPAELAGLST